MRRLYVRHLANIIDILWSRPGFFFGGGGGGPNCQLKWLTCCKRQKSVVTLQLQTTVCSTRGYRWTSHSIANSISLLK